jgi:uncharacterized membrane protein YdbT with pleckstrin-like domain
MIENKMFVVIGVLLIILLGLFVYLISIDLKVRRFEKRNRQPEPDDYSQAGHENRKQV